ncbi:hypothetical protein HanXRQr2_Chr14g0670401 [Helianthus annuus]|uniref:Uncharacterized protein n=1 Tax=Helianthus annuus TaxID=4232 RepID=A0A9K3EDC4_HELAN|nr:hypothetical protein HanXRQr2_Chr14g0670401 [Helianthus annuus]
MIYGRVNRKYETKNKREKETATASSHLRQRQGFRSLQRRSTPATQVVARVSVGSGNMKQKSRVCTVSI